MDYRKSGKPGIDSSMAAPSDVKQQVRKFYNQVGWQEVSEGIYQNARYEDLRPVSRDYIHRCHMRVLSHLQPSGKYLLDAGSGPIQYPEYLEYSRGYQYRVCADISMVALLEARGRIGNNGLFVVADIANLPFRMEAFEGVVSLHTIHHLPKREHMRAYQELYRTLTPGSVAVVVNGWGESRLMKLFNPLIRLSQRVRHRYNRLVKRIETNEAQEEPPKHIQKDAPKGTFTNKHDAGWIKNYVGGNMPLEILVWRSVSVKFLRNLIHAQLGGRYWLRILYWLEDRFPHYLGEIGMYPLIVIHKPE